MLQAIQDYYGMSPDFPLRTHLVMRTLDAAHPKRLYLVSDAALKVLLMDEKEQLKVVSTGLKVFDRQEVKDYDGVTPSATALSCRYRFAQEGLPYLLPYTTRQRVPVGLHDFLSLLKDRTLLLPMTNGTAPAKAEAGKVEAEAGKVDAAAGSTGNAGDATPAAPAPAAGAPAGAGAPAVKPKVQITDPELIAAVANTNFGCLVCELRPSDAQQLGLASDAADSSALSVPMALSAWRGKNSIAIMVDRAEIAHMVDKLEVAMSRVQGGATATATAAAAAGTATAAPEPQP